MTNLSTAQILQPEVTNLARLEMTTTFKRHNLSDRRAAPARGAWGRHSLDGQWRFQLLDNPDDAPDRWQTRSTRRTPWRNIEVPGCWTRQGTGDLPHYTNIVMPWPDLNPPQTPDHNPTGLYRRSFTVPDDWPDSHQVLVEFGGAESLVLVWCNGRFVGMSKDSRLAATFDLTPTLNQPGEPNELAAKVLRWSDGTWVEDQDHWWHAGLHRSVVLLARPPTGVKDLVVHADWDPEENRGTVRCNVKFADAKPGTTVVARLLRTGGAQIGSSVTASVQSFDRAGLFESLLSAYAFDGPEAVAEMESDRVNPWSAESPSRYRVLVEVFDPDGELLDIVSQMIGFRRVEVRDRRFLVNGRPIVLNGVNRHDHDPDTGKVVSRASMRDELVTMKRHNINAVRTAHYPNDPVLLDLCDELGLYVVAEANIESHARLESLSADPRWAPAILDRVRRAVARDRNHACIVSWSLGNEAGHGPAFDAAAAWVRAVDPTRPVQYEGAVQKRFSVNVAEPDHVTHAAPSARERATTDIVCPMYTPIDVIVRWAKWAEESKADDRPLVLCEYSHAMGNSNGAIAEYVNAFHSEPALAGGFVWDWRDQGLREVDDNGREFWAYGGHFGDEPNDVNFCINGLVDPAGVPHPALRELAWAARPVVITPRKGRKIRVTNRHTFTSTRKLRITWSLVIDDVVVETGRARLDVAPGKTIATSIPYKTKVPANSRAYVNIEWSQTRRTPWSKAGHVVAWDQIPITSTPPAVPTLVSSGASRHTVDNGRHTVAEGDVSVVFDESSGAFDGVRFGRRQVVAGDIAASLWRAPTDNDGVAQGWMSSIRGARLQWLEWGLDDLTPSLEGVRVAHSKAGVVLTVRRVLSGKEAAVHHRTAVTVTADGLVFNERLTIPRAWTDLPRVGVRFEAPKRLGRLSWRGLGPDETYPDRRSGSMVGWWSSTVADQYHPFVVPQEHGAHVDTEWFSLTDSRGHGLRVDGTESLVFTARAHHDADLTLAATIAELDARDTTEVHVDTAVRGLGTGACGPDTDPAHRVGPGLHEFTWMLRPVRGR